MKLQRSLMLIALLASGTVPALAQVEKVAVKTVRLSCGLCAVFSEIYLKQIAYVDTIQISKSKEAVLMTYKPGGTFQPADIRTALKKTEVGVAQFQIGARGRVQEQGGKQFFVAGKNRFVVVPAPNSPKLPVGPTVAVEGVVNDSSNPMELRVMTVKPVQP